MVASVNCWAVLADPVLHISVVRGRVTFGDIHSSLQSLSTSECQRVLKNGLSKRNSKLQLHSLSKFKIICLQLAEVTSCNGDNCNFILFYFL